MKADFSFQTPMARPTETQQSPDALKQRDPERERVFDAYRRWGFLAANLDPLGFFAPLENSELVREGAAAAEARRIYCGTIGAEFMHIPDPERRRWIAECL